MNVLSVDVFSVHVPSERLLLMNVLSVDVFSDVFSVHVPSETLLLMNVLSVDVFSVHVPSVDVDDTI